VALHVVPLDRLPMRKVDLDFLEIQEKAARQWLEGMAPEPFRACLTSC
jgi:hypothetical protein